MSYEQSPDFKPVFADPRTDFTFKRIFGAQDHKGVLIHFLNAILKLPKERLIVDVTHVPHDQVPPIDELKYSIVDVKCVDSLDNSYIIEMQIAHHDGFEARVVYNAAKAFSSQLKKAGDYASLCDVYGITICDFVLWPEKDVPMLSHWRMTEKSSGVPGLSQIQHVFLELPKYAAGENPKLITDKWAYFFREADNFRVIPPALQDEPFQEAFDVLTTSKFSVKDLEAYEKSLDRDRVTRGIYRKGQQEGIAEGMVLGEAKGKAERETEIALNLHRRGLDLQAISEVTGLSTESLDKIFKLNCLNART